MFLKVTQVTQTWSGSPTINFKLNLQQL